MAGANAVKTAEKQQVGTPFAPGKSGNPAGRPKGARAKLGEEFLKALQADFAKHGAVTVANVRADKPDQYLKVIASLLPKEITGENGSPLKADITVTFKVANAG